MTTKDKIRRLQKDGIFRFEGLTKEESRKAAARLAEKATAEDRKNGINCKFGIVRDVFGYYYAAQIND